MIWFTADLHLGHANMIKFGNRPFKHIKEMNEQLIQNYNELVGKKDEVYILGDFYWKDKGQTIQTLRRLNGKKFMILGNHDQTLAKVNGNGELVVELIIRPEVKLYVQWVKQYYELKVPDPDVSGGKRIIILMHYAMRTWNKSHWGTWQLYGHSHGGLFDDPNSRSIDVGVDAVAKRNARNGILNPKDYRPISYDEIKEIMRKKTFQPIREKNAS